MDSKRYYSICLALIAGALSMAFSLPVLGEELGIVNRKPVLGAACKTCPWGALAEILKEMMASYDYDVQICYNCARSDAPRIVSEARMPPQWRGGIPGLIPDDQVPPPPKAPVEFGVTSVRNLWRAYQGIHQYEGEGARDNLRLIGVVQAPSYLMVAVKADLGISDLSQIREKRWPIRILGRPDDINFKAILSYYDLSIEAIEAAGGSVLRGAMPQQQENFDIIIQDGSLGNAPEFNVWYITTQKHDLRFLELPEDLLKRLAKISEREIRNIPLGLLRGVDRPIPTVVRTGHAIYCRADAPDDFAYDVARAMYEHQDLLQWAHIHFSYNVHTVWKAFGVPLHHGAERYYREGGFMQEAKQADKPILQPVDLTQTQPLVRRPPPHEETIPVEGGLITGTRSWGYGVRMYRGIPYAAPPVGDLRWKAPQPVIPWEGVRAASDFGPSPMQRKRPPFEAAHNDGTHPYSEDCLYLNVWSPAKSPDEKLPVMVWIYGGRGVEGSGSEALYDPNNLAKKGVVVVTFNYRVNVFGWMAHPELTKESPNRSSGNYGALDQIAALKWVQNNISRFGGDPESVTIFGESGGSRSVNWLMASPLAKGLFHRAIGQSHSVFGRMMTLEEGEKQGEKFSRSIGAETLAELRAIPAEELEATVLNKGPRMGAPVVDGWFLPDDIYTIFANGKQNDVALITGGTNDETGSIAGASRTNMRPKDLATYTEWARASLGDEAKILLKHYPATTDAEARQAYHDVTRDGNMVGHRTWAKLQSTRGKLPAYLYLFSLAPPAYGRNGITPDRSRGAFHGSEITYVFDNLRYIDRPWTDLDRKVADMTSSYWVNFAKTGNPNGPGLPSWPVYDPKDEKLLNIGEVVRMDELNWAGLDYLAERMEKNRRGR